ncbi:MAG: transcriptional regulator [Hyphococcus sp.]|nr:MAG: transcriptional regulator [Marinicaulis sp.]
MHTRQLYSQMQCALSPAGKPHYILRTLSVDYDSGSTVSVGTHARPQLVHGRSDAVRAEVDDELWIIPPRRALLVPAQTPHKLKMLGRVKLRTLYCSPISPVRRLETRVIDVCGLLHEAILRCCELMCLDGRNDSDSRLAALITEEVLAAKSMTISLVIPKNERARRIADRFSDMETAHRELGSLLLDIGVSRRTAERLFQAETGLSRARWRRNALLSLAIERLAKGHSVAQIVQAVGYHSQPAFTEAFKRVLGFSPQTVLAHDLDIKPIEMAQNQVWNERST